MSIRRVVATSVIAAVVALAVAVSPAWAGTEGEPILADVTGDGRIDRVTLVRVDEICGVSVERGLGPNHYIQPHVHSYRLPGVSRPTIYCPDMGVAVDLAGDGTMELVVAWFNGPDEPTYEMLVLRNFQPHQTIDSMRRPGVIRTLDFNNDGLVDVWEDTDDGDGLLTYLNTPAGTLVPGPLKVPGLRLSDVEFVDLDGDRLLDVAGSYTESVSTPTSGVLVVFDDGTRVDLIGNPQGHTRWEISVLDADRNGRPDVRAVVTDDDGFSPVGTVTTFINRGDGSFVAAPVANDDLAHAYRATPKVIKVRDNDWAGREAALTIVTPPVYGRLTTTDPRYEIVYVRDAAHKLPDTFVYRLTQDGRSDTATVTVKMKD
jgi:hypothetical protein